MTCNVVLGCNWWLLCTQSDLDYLEKLFISINPDNKSAKATVVLGNVQVQQQVTKSLWNIKFQTASANLDTNMKLVSSKPSPGSGQIILKCSHFLNTKYMAILVISNIIPWITKK